MRKKNVKNEQRQTARDPVAFVRRLKESSSTDLGKVDHFGSSMATGGEKENRKITLDLNRLWIPRGGPTQAEMLRDDSETVRK